jgi:hypothetical protein
LFLAACGIGTDPFVCLSPKPAKNGQWPARARACCAQWPNGEEASISSTVQQMMPVGTAITARPLPAATIHLAEGQWVSPHSPISLLESCIGSSEHVLYYL